MANDLVTIKNPFLRAAEQLRTTGTIDRKAATLGTSEPAPTRSTRARLNFIPDSDMLFNMIDRALSALGKGRIFDRGAILNLLV